MAQCWINYKIEGGYQYVHNNNFQNTLYHLSKKCRKKVQVIFFVESQWHWKPIHNLCVVTQIEQLNKTKFVSGMQSIFRKNSFSIKYGGEIRFSNQYYADAKEKILYVIMKSLYIDICVYNAVLWNSFHIQIDKWIYV